MGAPLAAGILEELIALGARRLVICGGAGALVPALTLGHAVVPTAAVRDEGTSFHYLPPGREVELDASAAKAITETLEAAGMPYVTGKTWTTDGPYRETPGRVERRRAEGCLTVEMEAAALAAVAQFRGVRLGYLLYAGDSLADEEWDDRSWHAHPGRAGLFELAAEACLRL